MTRWKIADSAELYQIGAWSDGYFGIGADGRVWVHPEGPQGRSCDLFQLVHQKQLFVIGLVNLSLHDQTLARVFYQPRHVARANQVKRIGLGGGKTRVDLAGLVVVKIGEAVFQGTEDKDVQLHRLLERAL